MGMDQVKAGNVKNILPNWQKKIKNNKLLEKIKGARFPLGIIPIMYTVIIHPLHNQKLRLLMQNYQSFFKKV